MLRAVGVVALQRDDFGYLFVKIARINMFGTVVAGSQRKLWSASRNAASEHTRSVSRKIVITSATTPLFEVMRGYPATASSVYVPMCARAVHRYDSSDTISSFSLSSVRPFAAAWCAASFLAWMKLVTLETRINS